MAKEIALTQGKFTLVDDEDFHALDRWSWSFHGTYAHRKQKIDGQTKCIFMHRFILKHEGKEFVDHIDGNPLNNTKKNLRLCSRAENTYNKGPQANNTTGFKGVYWNKLNKNWNAYIAANKKRQFLGVFKSAEDAAKAYDAKAKELHREFAKLNFPLRQQP